MDAPKGTNYRGPMRAHFGHRYAFVVVGVTFLALLVTAGLRSAPSVMMVPL